MRFPSKFFNLGSVSFVLFCLLCRQLGCVLVHIVFSDNAEFIPGWFQTYQVHWSTHMANFIWNYFLKRVAFILLVSSFLILTLLFMVKTNFLVLLRFRYWSTTVSSKDIVAYQTPFRFSYFVRSTNIYSWPYQPFSDPWGEKPWAWTPPGDLMTPADLRVSDSWPYQPYLIPGRKALSWTPPGDLSGSADSGFPIYIHYLIPGRKALS